MTLTEEQRAAIEYVISSLEQCGSEPEDPVVAKILRAMIDSSEHVTDHTKMIGFDLEAARAGIAHYRIENPSNVDTESHLKDLVDQANLAEEYLAEIERLTVEHQNALDEVKNLEEQNLLRKQENERLLEALDESEKIVAHKTKSAAHWYDEHLQARVDLVQTRRVIYQRDAKIKELEDALVEMVATNPCNIPTLCDVVHDELMCPALDGNCDFWKGCPQKNELREAARKQLQAEGKIGSGGGA